MSWIVKAWYDEIPFGREYTLDLDEMGHGDYRCGGCGRVIRDIAMIATDYGELMPLEIFKILAVN